MVSLTPHEAMLEVYPRKMVQLFLRRVESSSAVRSSTLSAGRGSFRLAIWDDEEKGFGR